MQKNIVMKKVEKYREDNDITNIDQAFLEFINELFYSDTSEFELNDCIVDGQSDKQIDLIQIEEGDTVTIKILQVKKKFGFESNVVILLKNGLDWIFNREESEVLNLKNNAFKGKILEVRQAIANYNKKNIYVDIGYITLGNRDDIIENDEINAEIKYIENKYENVFENFTFKLYGAKEIYDYIDSQEDRTIDAKFSLIYDINKPSIIENEFNDVKSITCNVKALELIKIFVDPKSEYLFEQNIRKFLDEKSKVNTNIIKTASNENSEYFSILNNGVTIICDEYDLNVIGGKADVNMKNLQIINGCQTIMSLFRAYEKNILKEDTSLLLRIHETKNNTLIDKIIIATNDQNPVNTRDLLSNTHEQKNLQKYFYEMYNIAYQRKRNDFKDVKGNTVNKKDIIPNDKVGQAALACIKAKPNLALGSKGQVFTTHSDIFAKDPDSIALAWIIHEKVLKMSKDQNVKNNPEFSSIIKFGRLHITYAIFRVLKDRNSVKFNKEIREDGNYINDMIFNILIYLNGKLTEENKSNLLAYFKTKDSNEIINNLLVEIYN